MINPAKLFQLSGGQRRRKMALCFGALERSIAGIAEKGFEYKFDSMTRSDYIRALVRIVIDDPKLPLQAAEELKTLIDTEPFDERRTCNCARNHLLQIIGAMPSEWDLVIAPHKPLVNGIVEKRHFYPGVCVYTEDIRSPFNMGSIFRTAEGMGADKVYISPLCVSPDQKRALRSGMGCVETMGWERRALDELPDNMPVFVLETGGTPIQDFVFPDKGICIIGSEELGASPAALKKATGGRVSIPMIGLKASLNVGVAFGILMQKWVESLAAQ